MDERIYGSARGEVHYWITAGRKDDAPEFVNAAIDAFLAGL